MTTGGSDMELKTEILIIGGGASGMAAAVAAAEMGAEVTVAEANAAVGGNGLFPRGIFGGQQDTAQEACFCGQRSDFQGLYELFPLED